jgi:hypothetical protein
VIAATEVNEAEAAAADNGVVIVAIVVTVVTVVDFAATLDLRRM